MSGTAYLTQPRTPDGRWDRTGRIGSAGVRLDLAEEADVAYVLDRIRAAGARRIATLAYATDRRDLAEEFEANTFEFVYERATAADPDHPTITAGEVSRIIDGSWARHVHHMRTDSLHTRMSRGNSHLMRAWAAYAAAARDAQTRLGRPLSEAEHDQLAQVHARRAGTAMDIRRTGVAARHSYEDLTDGQAPSCPGAEEQWAAQADRRADERFEPPETARGRRALTEHYWQAKFPGAIAPQTIPRRAATGLRRTMDASPRRSAGRRPPMGGRPGRRGHRRPVRPLPRPGPIRPGENRDRRPTTRPPRPSRATMALSSHDRHHPPDHSANPACPHTVPVSRSRGTPPTRREKRRLMHNVFQDLPSIIAAVNAGGIIRVLGAIAILIGLWRWLGKGNRKTGMILVLLGACAVMYTVSLPVLGTIIGAVANLLLKGFHFLAGRM